MKKTVNFVAIFFSILKNNIYEDKSVNYRLIFVSIVPIFAAIVPTPLKIGIFMIK